VNEKEKAAYILGLQTAKTIAVGVLMDFEKAEVCNLRVDTGAEQSAVLVVCDKLLDAIRKARGRNDC